MYRQKIMMIMMTMMIRTVFTIKILQFILLLLKLCANLMRMYLSTKCNLKNNFTRTILSHYLSYFINPKFGLTIGLFDLTKVSVFCRLHLYFSIKYAITVVALLDTPAMLQVHYSDLLNTYQ